MGAKDFEKAYEYYCRAIDKQSDNFEAWNGCLYAVTRSLKFYEPDIVPITGYMGLMSIAYNCVKYASENHLPNIKNNLERVAMIFTEYAKRVVRPEYKDYENRQTTSGKGSRKWGIILIVIAIFIAPFFWPFALLSLVLGIVLIFSANKTINQIKTIESFISDENKQYINYFLNLIKDC